MNVAHITQSTSWFDVVLTGATTQVAVMDLEPGGGESGEKGNEHAASEQVLYVVEGEIEAEIGDETATLRAGDVVVVPRGVAHRFSNRSTRLVRTLNVYGPPAY